MKKSFLISVFIIAAFVSAHAQVQQQNQIVTKELSKTMLAKITDISELLKLANPSIDYSNYYFRSFTLRLMSGSNEVTEMAAGSRVSDKQKELIAAASGGVSLYFEKIRVMERGKKEITLFPDFIVIITD